MFLDLAIGIFTAIGISWWFSIPPTPALIIGGVIFALLPDVDYLFHLAGEGNSKNAHRHRDLLHYPLFYITLSVLLAYFYSITWAVLFGISSILHFFHDSIGIGWGVQWLWPFKKDHYAFFYLYRPLYKKRLSRKLVYIWKHEEIDSLNSEYGDENWFRNIYLHYHPYAVVEFIFFIGALTFLFLYVW